MKIFRKAPNARSILKFTLIAMAAIGVLSYAAVKSENLVRGPEIIIDNPKNGDTLSSSLVTILGVAKNIAFITLNDRQIYVDENGQIREQLLLSYGYNIITIKAKDKFGREVEKRLELVYK